jgi:hypothetical protein
MEFNGEKPYPRTQKTLHPLGLRLAAINISYCISTMYVVGSKRFRVEIQKSRQTDEEPGYFLKGKELLVHRCEKCVEIKGNCTEK